MQHLTLHYRTCKRHGVDEVAPGIIFLVQIEGKLDMHSIPGLRLFPLFQIPLALESTAWLYGKGATIQITGMWLHCALLPF